MPPSRDEESETQRKAHAKRVRETRRSTQGVTLDEIKSAEELIKKNNMNNNNNVSIHTFESYLPIAAPPTHVPKCRLVSCVVLIASDPIEKGERTLNSGFD